MLSEKEKRTLLLVIDYRRRAEAEREAGGYVKVNLNIPYVAVNCSNGEEYFFQGEEASNLIDEAEKAFDGGLSITDYIMAASQSW
jgi:hypothetical protein